MLEPIVFGLLTAAGLIAGLALGVVALLVTCELADAVDRLRWWATHRATDRSGAKEEDP